MYYLTDGEPIRLDSVTVDDFGNEVLIAFNSWAYVITTARYQDEAWHARNSD
jgi:hypothetical protein